MDNSELVFEPTTFVCHLAVKDPVSGMSVTLEVRRCTLSGALVGIDGSFLENTDEMVRNPYNRGFLKIDDDETN